MSEDTRAHQYNPHAKAMMSGTGSTPFHGFSSKVSHDPGVTRVTVRPAGWEDYEEPEYNPVRAAAANMLFADPVRFTMGPNGTTMETLGRVTANPTAPREEFGSLDPRDSMGLPTVELTADTRINYHGMTCRVGDLVRAGIMTRFTDGSYNFNRGYEPK